MITKRHNKLFDLCIFVFVFLFVFVFFCAFVVLFVFVIVFVIFIWKGLLSHIWFNKWDYVVPSSLMLLLHSANLAIFHQFCRNKILLISISLKSTVLLTLFFFFSYKTFPVPCSHKEICFSPATSRKPKTPAPGETIPPQLPRKSTKHNNGQ